MKYLEYYKSCMKTGKLLGGAFGTNGLCNESGFSEIDIFEPTPQEREGLSAYWASGVTEEEFCTNPAAQRSAQEEFTPTRQNIVLFLAAMNNEL